MTHLPLFAAKAPIRTGPGRRSMFSTCLQARSKYVPAGPRKNVGPGFSLGKPVKKTAKRRSKH